jgi:16S rRNA (guanine(966)-N(2))-methyltransferase RsmD
MDIRPTTDRVKESMFNIIQFDVPGARVLDLFAGSGALGIEALSRGAAHCVFVDASAEAVRIVRENVAACAMEKGSSVVRDSYENFSKGWRGAPFDLVFLDPPYQKGLINSAVEVLLSCGILSERVIIVAESKTEDDLPQRIGPVMRTRDYHYGNTKVSIYRREEAT